MKEKADKNHSEENQETHHQNDNEVQDLSNAQFIDPYEQLRQRLELRQTVEKMMGEARKEICNIDTEIDINGVDKENIINTLLWSKIYLRRI